MLSMIIIAHRGNTEGPNRRNENNPKYLELAMGQGYDVEIDLWQTEKGLYLGHDRPQYYVSTNWLKTHQQFLWIHAKNALNIRRLKRLIPWAKFFAHDVENYVLTSSGHIWTVHKEHAKFGIWVINDKKEVVAGSGDCLGICTDYANHYHSLQGQRKSPVGNFANS